jgi:hypothetical protein
VLNGAKMHAILVATQEDARISRQIAIQSQELSRAMKRDSVAMKTVGSPLSIHLLMLIILSEDCSHHHGFLARDLLRSKLVMFCVCCHLRATVNP